MKALLLTGYGGTDKYKLSTVSIPKPREDEVLVEISAIALNNTDVNTRLGRYGSEQVKKPNKKDDDDSKSNDSAAAPGSWSGDIKFPLIQGADGCGYIKDMGSNFNQNERSNYIGKRVVINPSTCEFDDKHQKAYLKAFIGSERQGTYAQYICVPISQVLMVDEIINDLNIDNHSNIKFSDYQLCSFLTAYLTAYGMIKDSNLKKGDILLITGASGGVGSALIQLSLLIGAIPIAIVGNNTKLNFAKNKLKCNFVINKENGDIIDQIKELLSSSKEMLKYNKTGKIDVIADVVGGDNFDSLLQLLRRGGVLVTVGAIAGGVVNINIRTVYLNWLTIIGSTIRTTPNDFKQFFENFVLNGKLKPLIAKVFYGIDQIPMAQEEFMKKEYSGKIVVSFKNHSSSSKM